MPHVIIIAGSNGAGKSTAAPALLKNALHVDNFVNADVIAQGLCAYQPEKAAIQAGRIMLDRIHTLANEEVNFNSNTNQLSLIASESKYHSLIIKDKEAWKQLLEFSNE